MNTNSIPYWNKLVEINDSLAGAPSGLLIFFVCIAFGYVWKMVRLLPNRFIPAVVMVTGACLNPLLLGKHDSIAHMARAAIIGFIIGFLAWLFHRLLLKKLEDKFGSLDDGNTDFINKPPTG
jgi:hypothetical protein